MQRTTDELLALLDEQGARLYAVLLRLTLRHDVADDLMQELFVRLSGHRGIKSASDPAAYAVRTATNLALDWRRAQMRRNESQSDDEALNSLQSAPCSPLIDLVNREETERVLNGVSQLPKRSGQIIVMHFLEQHSYEEIGRQTQCTAHHARALCHKAVEKLRRRLGVNNTFLQAGELRNEP